MEKLIALVKANKKVSIMVGIVILAVVANALGLG